MPNFKKLYFKLFNKVSDTVTDLQEVQCEIEEEIISDPDYTEDEENTAEPEPKQDEDDEDFGVC